MDELIPLVSGLVFLIFILIYAKKNKIEVVPKRSSKKPSYKLTWGGRPNYSAYPIHPLIVWFLTGLIILLVLIIVWLLFFAELPK